MVRWDEGLIDQASDVPSIIFFIIFYRLMALKTLYFYYIIKKLENKWKRFFLRILQETQHIILKIVGFLLKVLGLKVASLKYS